MDSRDLELLQAISDIMKNEMNDVRTDINGMKTDIKNMDNRLSKLENEMLKTNMVLENQIIPFMQALKEGYDGQRDKLSDIKRTVDEMASTVLALDYIHTKKWKYRISLNLL